MCFALRRTTSYVAWLSEPSVYIRSFFFFFFVQMILRPQNSATLLGSNLHNSRRGNSRSHDTDCRDFFFFRSLFSLFLAYCSENTSVCVCLEHIKESRDIEAPYFLCIGTHAWVLSRSFTTRMTEELWWQFHPISESAVTRTIYLQRLCELAWQATQFTWEAALTNALDSAARLYACAFAQPGGVCIQAPFVLFPI